MSPAEALELCARLYQLDLGRDDLYVDSHSMSPGRWCAHVTASDRTGDVRTDIRTEHGFGASPPEAMLAALRQWQSDAD